MPTDSPATWILGTILVASSLGVILFRQPVHACLSFLMSVLSLSAIYVHLSAEFIGVMQILVYAGAILVIFMFVIVLFQDAHDQISRYPAKSSPFILMGAALGFTVTLFFLGRQLLRFTTLHKPTPDGFGSVESLGSLLYIDFFFPFEAIVLMFLIAVVGALYIAKKGT